ncbi:MAG: hypothetical protein ACJ8G2_11570, partial [Burkholderiales bacterium]
GKDSSVFAGFFRVLGGDGREQRADLLLSEIGSSNKSMSVGAVSGPTIAFSLEHQVSLIWHASRSLT